MTPSHHTASVTLNGETVGHPLLRGGEVGAPRRRGVGAQGLATSSASTTTTLEGDPDAYAYLDYLEVQAPSRYAGGSVAARVLPWQPAEARTPPRTISSSPTRLRRAGGATRPRQAARRLPGRRRRRRGAVRPLQRRGPRGGGGPRRDPRRRLRAGACATCCSSATTASTPTTGRASAAAPSCPRCTGGTASSAASPRRTATPTWTTTAGPTLAIGRLPAGTAAQADALVAKVERQQALLAPGRGRHVFAVDNGGPGDPDFPAAALEALAALPGDRRRVLGRPRGGRRHRPGPAVDGLARGAAFTHYFGHGGPRDLGRRGAADRRGRGVAAHQRHRDPHVGLPVAVLPVPVGAVGQRVAAAPARSWGGGRVRPGRHHRGARSRPLLYERLYDELAQGRVRLGEAIRRAKARAVADEPLALPVVEGWNLLGDPSLVVDAGGRPHPPVPPATDAAVGQPGRVPEPAHPGRRGCARLSAFAPREAA